MGYHDNCLTCFLQHHCLGHLRYGKHSNLRGVARRADNRLLALHDRLTPGGAAVSGAKIGLAAAVLPLVGFLSGPLLGGAYGVYRSQTLTDARAELQTMLRELARG